MLFGDYIFIKVRGRAKAQEIIDEIYGKDFYKIRFMGLAPITGKEISARPWLGELLVNWQ